MAKPTVAERMLGISIDIATQSANYRRRRNAHPATVISWTAILTVLVGLVFFR